MTISPVIDSQVHVYEANTPSRPWRLSPNWLAHATGDEMVAAMDAVGVDGSILVSPFMLYGYDATYALDVCRDHPGRFGVVKPVDPADPASADVVAEWKRTPGAVGLRILMDGRSGVGAGDEGVGRIARAAAHHDLPINLHCWDNLDAAAGVIDRHPDTRFVIDHLGTVQPFALPVPPRPWDGLAQVLALARRPNVAIKVSGACTLSLRCYPFEDIWDPLARVFDAWGIDRCLWGTDWTRAVAVVGYKPAVEAFRLCDRLASSERAMLMGGACARVYGWSPS